METMIFQTMRQNNDVYGGLIPQSLQETINEWFDSRHVCDNDNFIRFFQRVLKRDYHRYNELLRIEAGAQFEARAGYDWLVNSYLEKEIAADHNSSGENGRTITTTPRVKTSTDSFLSISFGSTSTLTHGLKSETTYGRKDEGSTENLTDEGSANSTNSTAANKAMPASVAAPYVDSSLSDVELSGGVDIQLTQGNNDSFNSELSTPSAIAKNDTNSVAHSIRNASGSSSNQASGKDTVQNSGNDATAKTGADTHTGSVTVSKTGVDTVKDQGSTSDESHDLTHEIYTGRSGSPAEMLEKARQYIESTSAWEWFRVQLEPCFIGVYDI